MSLEDTLKACRTRIAGCQAFGCVDVASGFMLAINSDPPMAADDVDTLAAAASQLLNSVSRKPLATILPGGTGKAAHIPHAIVLGEDQAHIYVRSTKQPDLSVCAVFDPDMNPDLMIAETAASVDEVIETLYP